MFPFEQHQQIRTSRSTVLGSARVPPAVSNHQREDKLQALVCLLQHMCVIAPRYRSQTSAGEEEKSTCDLAHVEPITEGVDAEHEAEALGC